MKPAGYWPCYNEIISSALDTPRCFEPFADYFIPEKLEEIRDHYGADLYRECYKDALAAVVKLGNAMFHLRMCGVKCKPIFTPDESHVDYIAVFGLGTLTKARINQIVKKCETFCLFQV